MKRIVLPIIAAGLLVLAACSPPGSSLAGEPDALGRLLYNISVSKKVPKKVPTETEINAVETAKVIFEGLKPASGASIVLVHVKPGGNDVGDGLSWSTAKGTVGAALAAVDMESASNVHLILLASGTYRPAAPLGMKNHVAIIGGFTASADDAVGYYRGGATEISGNDRIQVFYNRNLDTKNAQNVTAKSTGVLARLTVTGGKADIGGGMYNDSSSPTVIHVSFSGNTATNDGGGMANSSSSPTVTHVSFSRNTANRGGGMLNDSSSPMVTHATFSGNTATIGGGMANSSSSPTVTHVSFSRNTANINGGGMHNQNSGPKIASSIFWESSIHNKNSTGNTAAPVVAHSIVEGGYTGGTAIITPTKSPFSGALGDNGGFVETIPIGSDSEAKDKGLYVARKGTTFYYSTDNSTWYTTPKASGTAATLPADAKRYTTDARGYSHNGRPDMGAYEHGGTAP